MYRELISIHDLQKDAHGYRPLDGVTLELCYGELVYMTGLEGSGAQELGRVLAGEDSFDAGLIRVGDRHFGPGEALPAGDLGIGYMTGHTALIPGFTVAENLFIVGKRRLMRRLPNRRDLQAYTRDRLSEYGLDIPPNALAGALNRTEQQAVQMIRLALSGTKLIVASNITTPRTAAMDGLLMDVMGKLVADGMCILWISGDIESPAAMARRVVVMRDGTVAKMVYSPTDAQLNGVMGYSIDPQLLDFPVKRSYIRNSMAFASEKLTGRHFSAFSFSVYRGECVGVFDPQNYRLQGELRDIIIGAARPSGGTMALAGQPYAPDSLSDAVSSGIGYIHGTDTDRYILDHMTVFENIAITVLKKTSILGLFISRPIVRSIRRDMEHGALGAYLDTEVRNLTGRQEVLLKHSMLTSRWNYHAPKLMLYAEPFLRGDILLRSQIAQHVELLKAEGSGVLVLSTRLRDLSYLCDRIVLCEGGRVIQELRREADGA